MPTHAETESSLMLADCWNILQTGNSLNLSGGADIKYEIELDSDEVSFFANLKHGKSFERKELKEKDQIVLEQLITAEIIVPKINSKKQLKVSLLGNDVTFLKSSEHIKVQKSTKNSDIMVIIRTTSTFAQLLNDIQYADLKTPHLFFDLSYHHTISIGPLVFFGETACLACLQGRITNRWGDDLPPPEPLAMQDNLGFAKELLLLELNKIATGDTSLVNKTISWNLNDRTIQHNQLLKVPVCPICSQNKVDHKGIVALPWIQDEIASNTIWQQSSI